MALNAYNQYKDVESKTTGIVGGYHAATLTGALTLDATYPNLLALDPNGADRNVTLDAPPSDVQVLRTIVNTADASEDLVVKNAAGTTIATVRQYEEGTFAWSGTAWSAVKVMRTRNLLSDDPQIIDMADAQVKLLLSGTPGAGELLLVSRNLFVDANSAGTEDLLLPAEAGAVGLVLDIWNTGGESIVVKEDSDTTTIVTIATAKSARVGCNGTTWFALLGA